MMCDPERGDRRRDEAGSGHEVVFESVSYLYLAWFFLDHEMRYVTVDRICACGTRIFTYVWNHFEEGRAISRVSYWKMASTSLTSLFFQFIFSDFHAVCKSRIVETKNRKKCENENFVFVFVV